jgi:hypothetical protein
LSYIWYITPKTEIGMQKKKLMDRHDPEEPGIAEEAAIIVVED